MSTYHTKVRTAIVNDGTVASIVGARVYALRAPQGSVLPYALITTISHQQQPHLRGVAALDNARIRVDMYGERYPDLQRLATAVQSAMQSASDFTATYVYGTEMFEDDTQLYHLVSEFSVWHAQ